METLKVEHGSGGGALVNFHLYDGLDCLLIAEDWENLVVDPKAVTWYQPFQTGVTAQVYEAGRIPVLYVFQNASSASRFLRVSVNGGKPTS